MITKYEHCRTCAYLGTSASGQTGCALTNFSIDPDKDYCSRHKSNPLLRCGRCNQILTPFVPQIYIPEENKIVCANCARS